MMFTRLIIFLLLFYLWNVTGVKRDMPEISDDTEDDDTEDDVSGSGSDEDEISYFNIGNYTFYSVVNALTKVTNNTIINISTDFVLSSIVTLKGLNNIKII